MKPQNKTNRTANPISFDQQRGDLMLHDQCGGTLTEVQMDLQSSAAHTQCVKRETSDSLFPTLHTAGGLFKLAVGSQFVLFLNAQKLLLICSTIGEHQDMLRRSF